MKKIIALLTVIASLFTFAVSAAAEETGHNWGEWETVVRPKVGMPGTERRVCLNAPEKKILSITLDAGHTKNYNKGAINGYYEGNMSFTLMSYLKEALERYSGVMVYTTRQNPEDYPALQLRGALAAESGSELFISIHSNASNKQTVEGVSVFRSFLRPESEELGVLLGQAVTDVINETTGTTYLRNNGQTMIRTEEAYGPEFGDGVTQDYYCVTRNSVMSEKCRYSYIIEHGFHTNRAECSFLMDDNNIKKLAEAEAAVIASYFNLDLKGSEPEEVQYRQIPALTDENEIVYDLPVGFTADASGAFPGGTLVRATLIESAELLSKTESVYNFKLSADADGSDGDIYISIAGQDNVNNNIGAYLLEKADCLPVTKDEENGALTFSVKDTGTYFIYSYIDNDVNFDGSVNNKDVVSLFRFTVQSSNDYINKLAADPNGDGKINNKDVVVLFRIINAID